MLKNWKFDCVGVKLNRFPKCYIKEIYTYIVRKKYSYNHPKKLYKYFGCSQYSLENLKNNQITFSNPIYFNDPYDCALYTDFKKAFKIFLDYDEYKKEVEEISLIDIQEAVLDDETFINEYEKEIKNFVNKIRVTCLSEKNDSILMWSHYAVNHTGFSIEYNFDDIEKQNRIFLPVIYKTEISEISMEIMNDNKDGMIYPLISKAKDWEYEDEWRIIEMDMKPCECRRNMYMKKQPIAVYLGCKIDKSNEERIIQICIENNIQLYKMNMKKDAFKLEYSLVKKYEQMKYIKNSIYRSNANFKYSLIGLNSKYRWIKGYYIQK